MDNYLVFDAGTYITATAAGTVVDIPGSTAAIRVWVTGSNAYFVMGDSTLAVGSVVVPAVSGDPSSPFCSNGWYLDLKKGRNTHIAFKAPGAGTAVVHIIPFESAK